MATPMGKETAKENPAADHGSLGEKGPAPAGLFLFVARGATDVAVQQPSQAAACHFYQFTFT